VKLMDFFVIAIRSLFANKLRSLLTMLGIIIGVGAVISLMSVGRGAEAMVTSTFEQMGTNVVYVMHGMSGGGLMGPPSTEPTLTTGDAETLANPRYVRSVIAVAPSCDRFGELTFGGESVVTRINGVTPDSQWVLNYSVDSGQFISDRNVAAKDMVVVLGSEVAEDLFGSDDPVGQRVKIQSKRFTVIGILETKGGQMMGVSIDDIVLTPITTFQTRLFTQRTASGEDAIQSIAVQVSSAEMINEAMYEIETTLRTRHRLADDAENDFTIISQEEIIGMLQQVTGVFTLFLGAIAGISLLVGSIGIMNIMLVSVTERTREIGIRKAIGAKRRDILIQFLLEALMLSSVGGGIGIIGGSVLSALISRIEVGGQTIPSIVSPDIVLLAISVCLFIGLASGIYPAMRAARLNPIDALHYG